jgi:hypothetical protein
MRAEDELWSQQALIPYTPRCVERAIEVCVHPAYESLLDDTADAIAKITAPLLGVPGAPVRAAQLPSGAQSIQPDGTLGIMVGERRDIVLATAASGLVIDPASMPTERASAAQVAIGRWLMLRAGVSEQWRHLWLMPASARDLMLTDPLFAEIDAAVLRFAALDAAAQRAWLERHFADLRAGRVTLDDLP